MKIYTEKRLSQFEFWSGAKDTADRIWEEMGESGFDTVEAILEDTYPEGIDETTLNDIFGLSLKQFMNGWECQTMMKKKRRATNNDYQN